jgi:hypothetical protein
MATQIVMDRAGDTRHNFDAKDAHVLLKAEERFRELTGPGFTAAARTASGEAVVKRTFDRGGRLSALRFLRLLFLRNFLGRLFLYGGLGFRFLG